jgi:hypothetical protein
MADIPTELTQQIALVDPQTGLPSQDALQKINAIIRYLKALNVRVTDLE